MYVWPIALLCASALFIVYVLAGYPLLLGWMARRYPRPFERRFEPRSVSVILPVHNGAAFLPAKLESIFGLAYPKELLQVIVVSDGSTDETNAIAGTFAARGVALIVIEKAGKAAALNAALARATGEILFLTDVRQELEPQSLSMLIACFADPEVGVASGELMIRKGDSNEEENTGLYWKYEKWIRRRLSRLDSVLGATGAIYAIRRSLAEPMPSGTLLDDVHLPLSAFFKGYRVVFVEEAKAFDYPTALDAEFRRKVRTLAGVYQIIAAYPALLGPANRMWIHFVSHKLGRLLLPFALLLILFASAVLPLPWSAVLLAGQAAFYGLALLDSWMPERSPLKRFSSIARMFCVMMWAALCAVSIWFVPSDRFWSKPTSAFPGQPRR